MKKLYKSGNNKIIAGIFGGLGEYLDVDPVLLRIIGLVFFALTGFVPFLIIYLISSFIVPKRKEE